MEKIRTLQMMGGGKAGGAEIFFVRLMTALAQRPDDIEVLPVVKKGGWAAERLGAAGLRYATAGFGGWMDRSSLAVCKRLAGEFQPNLCMSWMNRATRFMPQPHSGGAGWVTVARLGGYYPLKYYRDRVTELVGNTQDIVDYCVKSGWSADHASVVGNFVPEPSMHWHQGRAEARRRIRQRLAIPEDAPVALVASRLHTVKGYDTALKALAQLPPIKGQRVRLIGVGEGPERQALENLAAGLDMARCIRLAGWVDNLGDYAAAADVWLLPSRHEPLGNSVLDAWGYQVPLIATQTAGPLTLVEDGTSGLLVPVDDVAALAGGITRILQDRSLGERLVAGGLARLRNDFSEEVIIDKYLATYRRMITQRQVSNGNQGSRG